MIKDIFSWDPCPIRLKYLPSAKRRSTLSTALNTRRGTVLRTSYFPPYSAAQGRQIFYFLLQMTVQPFLCADISSPRFHKGRSKRRPHESFDCSKRILPSAGDISRGYAKSPIAAHWNIALAVWNPEISTPRPQMWAESPKGAFRQYSRFEIRLR